MTKIERVYNVPLRKEWLKVPKYQRAAKAMRALRAFALRHMKTEEVIIGPFANQEVWKQGIQRPPHHIKINAVKDDDGKVVIELFGKPIPSTTKEKPMEKGAVKKAVEALTGMKIKDKKPVKEEAKAEKTAAATPVKTAEQAGEGKTSDEKTEPKPAKKEAKAKVVKK